MSHSFFKESPTPFDNTLILVQGRDGTFNIDKEVLQAILNTGNENQQVSVLRVKNESADDAEIVLETYQMVSNDYSGDGSVSSSGSSSSSSNNNSKTLMDHDYTPYKSPSQLPNTMSSRVMTRHNTDEPSSGDPKLDELMKSLAALEDDNLVRTNATANNLLGLAQVLQNDDTSKSSYAIDSNTETITGSQSMLKNGHGSSSSSSSSGTSTSSKKTRKINNGADLLFSSPDIPISKRNVQSTIPASTTAALTTSTQLANQNDDFLTEKCTNEIYDEIINLEKEIRSGNVSLDDLKAAGDCLLVDDDANDVSVDIANLELDCNPEDLVIDDFINNIAKMVELDEGDGGGVAGSDGGPVKNEDAIVADVQNEKIAIESESDDEDDPIGGGGKSKSRLASKMKLSERSLQIHQKLSKSSASRLSLKNFQKSEQLKAASDGSTSLQVSSSSASKSSKKRLSLRENRKQTPRFNRTRYMDTENDEEERTGVVLDGEKAGRGVNVIVENENCAPNETIGSSSGDDGVRRRLKKKIRNGDNGQLERTTNDDDDGEDENENENENDDDEIVDDHSWDSEDDPDRLWCICRKPHNNRFMISCDRCEDWFHGKCVNVTQSMGKKWEQTGKEWTCPNCLKKDKDGKISKKSVQMKCANCRQPIEKKTSAYCSDRCILAHIQGLEKFVLIDVITMKCISGNALPLPANLKNWLKDHPTYQVVKKENKDANAVSKPRMDFLPTKKKLVTIVSDGLTKPTSVVTSGGGGGGNVMKKQQKTETEIIQKITQQNQTLDKSRTKFLDINSLPDFRRSQSITSGPIATPISTNLPQQKTNSPIVQSAIGSNLAQNSSSSSPSRPGSIERKKSDKLPIVLTQALQPPQQVSQQQQQQQQQLVPPKIPKAKISPSDREKVIRENVRKTMKDQLELRINESSDIKIESDELQKLVDEIELELLNVYENPGQKYLTKYRSLLFNIKDTKNNTLWKRICKKKIAPSRLVRLSTEELASQELSSWRERETKHQLEIIKRTEMEALQAPQHFIMKSRHGEELRHVTKPKSSVESIEQLNDSGADGDNVQEIGNIKAENSSSSSGLETTTAGSDDHDNRTTGTGTNAQLSSVPSSNRSSNKESGTRSKKDHERRHHDRRSNSSNSSSSSGHKNRDKTTKHKDKRSSESVEVRKSSVGHHENNKNPVTNRNDVVVEDDGLDEGSKALLKDIESLTKVDDSLLREFERKQELEEQKKQQELDELKQLEQLNRQAEERLTKEIEELERQVNSGESKYDLIEPVSGSLSKQRSILKDTYLDGCVEECDNNDDDHRTSGYDDYTLTNNKWRGLLHISESSNFFINAIELSAISTNLETDITKFLQIKGRLEFSVGWNYIEKMKKSQISILKLIAASYEDKAGYMDYFNYLYTRSRLGVVKCETDNIKDFYIFPWPEKSPLPAVLYHFVSKNIEDDNPNTLLAILVRSKRKMTQLNLYEDRLSMGTTNSAPGSSIPPVTLDPRMKKAKKSNASGSTTVVLPKTTTKSRNSRKSIVETKDDSIDDNLDEPYSPTDYSMQLDDTNDTDNKDDVVNDDGNRMGTTEEDTDLRLLSNKLLLSTTPSTTTTSTSSSSSLLSTINKITQIPLAPPPPPLVKPLKYSTNSSTEPHKRKIVDENNSFHETTSVESSEASGSSILNNFEPFSNRFLTIPGLETEPATVEKKPPDASELPFLGNINIPQNLQEILQTINAIKTTTSNQIPYEPSPAKKSRFE